MGCSLVCTANLCSDLCVVFQRFWFSEFHVHRPSLSDDEDSEIGRIDTSGSHTDAGLFQTSDAMSGSIGLEAMDQSPRKSLVTPSQRSEANARFTC